MSSPDLRQDTLAKRKQLSRSDAVVGDDDNKVKPNPSSVATSNSKDNSTIDMMGIDVLQFIEATLHKNAKDREFLLQIEEEFNRIVADDSIQYHFLPEMTSYNRMLVHRVAAYFGFIHNVDQAGKSVVVTKQKGTTKQPLVSFSSLIKHANFTDQYSLFRRTVQSFDESIGPGHRFPPSRNFRNRFYTASGQYNNGELNHGRRARSFEASDYGGLSQQFIGSGGELMRSNCSSRASSSAIPAQIQSINLPLYQPAVVPLIGNDVGLLSPSNASAYSEPIHPYHQPTHPIYYRQGGGEKPAEETNAEIQQLSEKEEEETSAEENANANISNGNGQSKQQQCTHPHIPSLFSIQPIPPQFYAANPPQQYYPPPQYQTTYYQYQPMILSPSPVSTATHFNMPAATCYPNYYPIYQQLPNHPAAIPYMQPHPLLEENNSRYLANQLNLMNLNAAETQTHHHQQIGPQRSAAAELNNSKESQQGVPKQ